MAVASVLAFESDDPSSNPAVAYIFIWKLYEKNWLNRKEPGDGQFKQIICWKWLVAFEPGYSFFS